MYSRGYLIEVHIADLHFGAFDPKTQYDILMEQFLEPISKFPRIDIIVIDGDTFDHKVMSSSDTAMYAVNFVDHLVDLAREKGSTLVILGGTASHEANQLKLFYHYMEDPTVDVRVVTNIQFEDIKGAKILCVPELNGLDESIYNKFFHETCWYDEAFCHGTFEGSVYGNLTSGNSRLLTAHDFDHLKGVAISGHVHKPGCFEGFYYYCGCPYRWKFGEEEEKGYLVLVHDLDTQIHYVEFEPIKSFRYDTIYLDELVSEDPKQIIDYINTRKQKDGIDYIKVRFRYPVSGPNKTVINNYYRNVNDTFVEFIDTEEIQKQKKEQEIQNTEYSYLLDNSISDLDRFVRYVNEKEGSEFITVEKLTSLLQDSV